MFNVTLTHEANLNVVSLFQLGYFRGKVSTVFLGMLEVTEGKRPLSICSAFWFQFEMYDLI